MPNTSHGDMIKINDFHINSYNFFIDREKNKPCLIVGMAPNIVEFPFEKFNGIFISMNEGPFRLADRLKSDYWITANTLFPVPENDIEKINSLKNTVFLFADSVVYRYKEIDIDFLSKKLRIPWFNFDQHHFGHNKCTQENIVKNKIYCCKLLDLFPERETLQEFTQRLFNQKTHYSTASTVAIHALAFSLIMGCNPIYIHGIELPKYQKDYAYPRHKEYDKIIYIKPDFSGTLLNRYFKILKYLISRTLIYKIVLRKKSVFYRDIAKIIEDFKYLINIAKANNRDIYIFSKTTTLRNIRGIKYMTLKELQGIRDINRPN